MSDMIQDLANLIGLGKSVASGETSVEALVDETAASFGYEPKDPVLKVIKGGSDAKCDPEPTTKPEEAPKTP